MFYWKTTKYGASMLRLMPSHIPVIVQPEKTYRHKARNILPIVAAVWSAACSSTLTENDWSTKKYSHNQSFNSALKRRSGAIFFESSANVGNKGNTWIPLLSAWKRDPWSESRNAQVKSQNWHTHLFDHTSVPPPIGLGYIRTVKQMLDEISLWGINYNLKRLHLPPSRFYME